MVKHITRLLLTGMFGITLNAHGFELEIKQPNVELGKPVWVQLSSQEATPSLGTIDFSILEKEFEVIKDNNELQQLNGRQHWRIRLYPRHTGRLTIPSIQFRYHRSRDMLIEVTDPVDPRTGQSFSIDYQLSTHTAWVRQQVTATYKIHSREARLVLRPQEMQKDGLLSVPFTTSREQEEQHYLHQSGWALFATQAGKYQFKLPALYYVRDGVITHRFYPPPVTLKVSALPGYLPSNIPVGKLSFKVINNPALVIKHRLSELAVQLEGEGIPRQWLPDIQHIFNANHQLNSYPVEIETSQTHLNVITSRHEWRVPFKSLQQGIIDLPTIKLHYFDPHSGRLAKLDIQVPRFISLSLWLVMLFKFIGISIFGLSTVTIYRWIRPHWLCFQTYRHISRNIEKLKTAHDIRQTIKQIGHAERWPDNLSLRQWQARQPAHLSRYAHSIIQQLEAALYQGKPGDLDLTRNNLQKICSCRWKIFAHTNK